MHHLTMNNGAHRWSPREVVDAKVLATVSSVIHGGKLPTRGHLALDRLPNPAPCVAAWSIVQGEQRKVVATAMQCWHPEPECAAAAWAALEQAWFTASDAYPHIAEDCDLPSSPPSVPWLGVILWPTVAEMPQDVRNILEPLEYHIAWAVMESEPAIF